MVNKCYSLPKTCWIGDSNPTVLTPYFLPVEWITWSTTLESRDCGWKGHLEFLPTTSGKLTQIKPITFYFLAWHKNKIRFASIKSKAELDMLRFRRAKHYKRTQYLLTNYFLKDFSFKEVSHVIIIIFGQTVYMWVESHCNSCQFLKTKALEVYSNGAVTQLRVSYSISCGFNRNY